MNRRRAVGLGAIAAVTLTSCSLLSRPMAPQFISGAAVIEELNVRGVSPPTGPIALAQGSFIDDPSDEARGGARAVFGDRTGWQILVERFGMPTMSGSLVILLPPDADGVRQTIAGEVGSECQAEISEASASGLAGVISCEMMSTDLSGIGTSRGVSARISFDAQP